MPKVGCQTSTPALVKHVPKLPRLPHEGVTMPTESFASVAETFQRKQARRDAASRGLQTAVRESAVAVHALHRGDLHSADSALAAADAALQVAVSTTLVTTMLRPVTDCAIAAARRRP